jgi:hypothetical protein
MTRYQETLANTVSKFWAVSAHMEQLAEECRIAGSLEAARYFNKSAFKYALEAQDYIQTLAREMGVY